VLDHARAHQLGVDHDHAAHGVVLAVEARHDGRRVDAVLETHNGGVGAEQGPERLHRHLDVVELDPQQHDVDRAYGGGVVGGRGGGDVHVAERARHPQARRPDGGQVRAARDEGDAGASRPQAGAEIAPIAPVPITATFTGRPP